MTDGLVTDGDVLSRDVLHEGAARFGVVLTSSQQAKLVAFAALIRRWNSVMNLVARDDVARLEARHILDSLAFAPHLRGERVADLGTGAGLPGLPLAIADEHRQFSLIDRSDRRIRFVRQAVIELELANVVEVLTVDLARFRPAKGFDTVVARALAPPDKTWGLARPMLAPHGRAVFAAADGAAAPTDADIVARVVPVDLPGVERRHQLIIVDVLTTRTLTTQTLTKPSGAEPSAAEPSVDARGPEHA